uniref:Uncharacterized protein n=1 Tax=Rhizophora mucronata TaxID=61149 RepID=A0A2P2PB23_RHIMU
MLCGTGGCFSLIHVQPWRYIGKSSDYLMDFWWSSGVLVCQLVCHFRLYAYNAIPATDEVLRTRACMVSWLLYEASSLIFQCLFLLPASTWQSIFYGLIPIIHRITTILWSISL